MATERGNLSATKDPAATAEAWMSYLLRVGTLTSLSLIFAGLVVSFVNHPDYFWSAEALVRVTNPEAVPHSLSDVFAGLLAAKGRAIGMLGLLVLVGIPPARLVVAHFGFVAQRDRTFATLSLVVLGLLALSLLLGAHA